MTTLETKTAPHQSHSAGAYNMGAPHRCLPVTRLNRVVFDATVTVHALSGRGVQRRCAGRDFARAGSQHPRTSAWTDKRVHRVSLLRPLSVHSRLILFPMRG